MTLVDIQEVEQSQPSSEIKSI